MPNLTGDIGTDTGFRPTSVGVVGTQQNKYNSQIASGITAFAKGAGKGFAEGTAQRERGEGETQVDADAAVAEAFKQPAPVEETLDASPDGVLEDTGPTKEDIAKQRADFLADAALNEKRVNTALAQGKIGSAEANNWKALNRKRFANGPITSLFLKDYDKAVGGGSGSARGAYFGKTAAEKAQDKITTQRITDAANDEMMAEKMVEGMPNMDIETAREHVAVNKANKIELDALTNKERLGALGATEATRKFKLTNAPKTAQMTAAVQAVIDTPGGAKADTLEQTNRMLTLNESQTIEEIQQSNMMPTVKDAEITRVKSQYTRYRESLKDTSYAEAQKSFGEENANVLANIKSTETLNLVSTSLVARRAYAISGEAGMLPAMEFMMKSGSKEFAFAVGTDPMYAWIAGGATEVAESADSGGAKVIGGTGELTKAEASATGLLVKEKGIPTTLAKAYADNPEGVGAQIDKIDSLQLEEYANDREWQGLAKSDPKFVDTTITASAKHARVMQMSQGVLPETFTMSSVIRGKGRADRRNWTFETGGVPLTDRYKSELVGAYKLAEKNPAMWENEFASVSDYVANKFAYKGPAPSPQNMEEEQADRAKVDARKKESSDKKQAAKDERLAINAEFRSKSFLDRSFGEGSSEAVGNVLGRIANFPASMAVGAAFEATGGQADYDNPEYEAFVKERNPELHSAISAFGGWPEKEAEQVSAPAAVASPIMDAVVQVETGGQKDPFIRTKSIPKEGSTAYGPLQVTKTLATKAKEMDIFDEEEQAYLDRFIAQADKFNKYGTNPARPDEGTKDKEGYDARFDYGGAGELTSEADRAMYMQVMTKLFNEVIGDDQNPESIAKKWHGGKDEAKIADYAAKLRAAGV